MIFTLYHESRNHTELCVFEEYGRESGLMVECGKPAVGVGGWKKPLCSEHFGYVRSVRKGELKHELPRR